MRAPKSIMLIAWPKRSTVRFPEMDFGIWVALDQTRLLSAAKPMLSLLMRMEVSKLREYRRALSSNFLSRTRLLGQRHYINVSLCVRDKNREQSLIFCNKVACDVKITLNQLNSFYIDQQNNKCTYVLNNILWNELSLHWQLVAMNQFFNAQCV